MAEANREDIRYRMAKVVTVGNAVVGVENDDDIYYDKHAGFGIELKDKQFKVIKEVDVVVVL